MPAPSNCTWSTTAMCIENVVVCMIGSASVFHCEVSEPPTARKPATRGFEHPLVHAERDGRLLSLRGAARSAPR